MPLTWWPASCIHGSKVSITVLLCRYGLFDSDDEEEDVLVEPMQESTPPQPPKDFKGKAAQAVPPKQGYGLFDEDEDMDDDLGSDQTG